MQINLIYDSSVNAAPAGFKPAMAAAAQALGALIINSITVNIQVGYGEDGGLSLGGALATGGPSDGINETYGQLRSELFIHATSPADTTALANLPLSDPTGGGSFYVTSAQQKAWGLLSPTASGIDGSVGFSTTDPFNYSTTSRAAPGKYDFIGVAEHELTHAIGRAAGLQYAPNQYMTMDLFRYASAGHRELVSGVPAYFSINNGATNLNPFDTVADNGDWASTVNGDSFGYASMNTVGQITSSDKTLLDVLGFTLACFVTGTRIRTTRGEVPVECLRAGEDTAVTAAGRPARVTWIGHRTLDCSRHPNARDVMPVRVRAGALGPGQPARDLRLSPDHAVFLNGVLIPVRHLTNGATIVQKNAGRITYWHVELDRHDVLLAESLPCESYLDTGNRAAFDNGGAALSLHPDFARGVWDRHGCAKLVEGGPELAAIRARLLDRARALGYALTDAPALHLVAGGRIIVPERDGPVWRFDLPARACPVRLRSPAGIPAETRPARDDWRRLGVAIGALRFDGVPVRLADPRLTSGWHNVEDGWRWTDGDAGLALAGVRRLELTVVMAERHWVCAQAA